MSDSDQQQQLHPEQQLQSNAALCAALQSVIDHSILRFDDNVDTSSECICELLRAQLSKSFAVEVVTITGTDILNNDVFTFSGRADAHEDCSVLCVSLTWDNQPLPSCSIATVARQLSNLTFQSGVAVSHSIHVDCDGQEWVPLAMGVACGDTDSREASVFLAHSNAAPSGSRATDSGFHFSMFCTAAPGDVKNVGQDWSDVVTKCEGHWLLRDRVLGRCWPTFVLLSRKVDWQSIASERKPPSPSNSNTPSRSPSLSPAESPAPLLLLAPPRDSASSDRELRHFTEAPTRQFQLHALQAQLALIDVRESQLQHMDARAAEVETCAGWRQAAIDMSDSVCELTRQLQQRDREILELQARRHLLCLFDCSFALTRLPRSARTPWRQQTTPPCSLFRTSSCGRWRTP